MIRIPPRCDRPPADLNHHRLRHDSAFGKRATGEELVSIHHPRPLLKVSRVVDVVDEASPVSYPVSLGHGRPRPLLGSRASYASSDP